MTPEENYTLCTVQKQVSRLTQQAHSKAKAKTEAPTGEDGQPQQQQTDDDANDGPTGDAQTVAADGAQVETKAAEPAAGAD